MESLQLENGNYLRIVNVVIEKLIQIPFEGCELAVALFIIRKTWGFNKKEDQISLTQFEKGVCRSRMTVVKALKNLVLLNIIILVKRGTSKTSSNKWRFNKYYKTWQLVNTPILVKSPRLVYSKGGQLVKPPIHTKDNIQKTNTPASQEITNKDEKTMQTNKMGKYREDGSSDSYEDVVDADSGETISEPKKVSVMPAYKALVKWAADRRGSPFVNTIKQYTALKKIREAGIKPDEVKNKWTELETDKFWGDKGFDFTIVASQFDKKR